MSNATATAPARATKAEARPSKGARNPRPTPPMRCSEEAGAGAITSTRIELFIRPAHASKFGASFSYLHDQLGITSPRIDATRWRHAACICDPDTGYEIAEFKPNQGYQFGDLTEVSVSIDPATCALSYSAGHSFASSIKTYAEGMGGKVFDGLGAEVTGDALKALGKYISTVVCQRIEDDETARTTKVDEFTTRRAGRLPFQHLTRVRHNSGKTESKGVYFDAPARPYMAGHAEGYRMAKELVEYLRTHMNSDANLFDTLCEAGSKTDRSATGDSARVAHVANGFMECIATITKVGAKALNMKWLDARIAQYDEWEESDKPLRDARNAAFVARMKAARLAKQKKGGTA